MREREAVYPIISWTKAYFKKYQEPEKSRARNDYESLIDQIVDATNKRNKSKLRGALAVAGRTLGWTEKDLHNLYQKRLDPEGPELLRDRLVLGEGHQQGTAAA